MEVDSETAALVALLRLGRHTGRDCVALVNQAGSAMAALHRVLGSDGTQTTLFIEDAEPHLAAAAADIRDWRASGIELVTLLDARYPSNLRAVHDRPPLVFVAGSAKPEDARSIAVIGARRASSEGLELASSFAAGCVRGGYTVVSGLAAGIDTAAHVAALEHGGRTIAVIGTGLQRSYPPENAALQRRIASGCAVISQFWPDAPPIGKNFPMRNAVMSGVSRGSIVIEASEQSGARIQARLALAHGRPVFVLERLLRQSWARELASRPGAYVVRSPEEVMQTLERDGEKEPGAAGGAPTGQPAPETTGRTSTSTHTSWPP